MNYLNKFILNRAAKIQKPQKAKEGIFLLQNLQKNEYEKRRKKEVYDLLVGELNKEIEVFKTKEWHIKPNSKAILNIYNFERKSDNGWDSGAVSLINVLRDKHYDILKPIVVSILDVYIDTSYAILQIENYIENTSTDKFELNDFRTNKDIILNFQRNLNINKNFQIGNFGLYVAAHFEYINDGLMIFKPQWGLNINSFLDISSDAAIKTNENTRQYLFHTYLFS